MRRWFGLVATVGLVLAGCAPQGAVYDRSIYSTAVYDAQNVKPLKPLAYPVQAASLTSYPQWGEDAVGKTTTLQRDTWITVEPEVKAICRTYPRAQVVEKLHQLLGLKPATADDAKQRFVRFVITRAQPTGPTGNGIFRPCADPDPAATACGNAIKGPDAYVSWFAKQMASSYVMAPTVKETGYPWTRLGYTYNWDPVAPTSVGAQEYVVPAGTEVTVTEVVTPEEYCAAP
ncbi:MAG TPA: hypothetical protein VD995_11535 [Azospirillum sp.]|nr:hypothetical protein [Azospirillum sp.]